MEGDLKYWIAMAKTGLVGAIRFKKLCAYFADMRHAYEAESEEFIKAGLEPNTAEKLCLKLKEIDPNKAWEEMEMENVEVVNINDDKYPKLLKEIYDAPALFFYKGNWNIINNPSLGVVGSRKISLYARQTTPYFIRELAKSGMNIISGMALGVDALAHQHAMDAGEKTIAVLGSGLDKKNIYPPHNRDLFQKMVDSGSLIISEYPIGTPPLNFNFPQRNRIISGLSLGVLVIEAGQKSGALITAKTALDQGREVFAIPGNIFQPNSCGTNELIKNGAHLVSSPNDILEILNFNELVQHNENKKIFPESSEEEKIMVVLEDEPLHIDTLGRLIKIDAASLNSVLMMMEMKGMIKNYGGGVYGIKR